MKQWLENLKNGKKDQILILLLLGVLLVVIAWPSGNAASGSSSGETAGITGFSGTQTGEASSDGQESGQAAAESAVQGSTVSNLSGTGTGSTETELEERLESILSHVEGIGETQVMITLKSDGRKVVEKDTQQSESKEENGGESESSTSEQMSGSETTIYEKSADGDETPFVTEELSPEILGVLVIAQGADSSSVVTEITEAVMALFGIEAHKIKVMKME
ncbi:MAG: stage III sporulation protein AG [Lachnospiraceae bacterium]|nr:stage III sporulation protein AG [Lachnospiraceae bacterium]